jgi:exopolysaccharide production protein ExoQ
MVSTQISGSPLKVASISRSPWSQVSSPTIVGAYGLMLFAFAYASGVWVYGSDSESLRFAGRSTERTIRILFHVAAIMLVATHFGRWLLLLRTNWPLLLFCAVTALSSLWSRSPADTIFQSRQIIVESFFVIGLVAAFGPTLCLVSFSRALATVVGGSLALSLLAPSLAYSSGVHTGLLHGLLPHKNLLGHVGFLSVATAVCLLRGRAIKRTEGLIYISLAMISLVLAGSTTAIILSIAVFPLSLLGGWVLARPLKRLSFVLALCAFALVFAAVGGLNQVGRLGEPLYDLFGKSSTFSGRDRIWSYLLQGVLQHPIGGIGYGAFGASELLTGARSGLAFSALTSAHNSLLQTLVELGILGGLLLVFWVLWCLRSLRHVPITSPFALTIFVTVVASCAYSTVETVGLSIGSGLFATILMSVCASAIRPRAAEPRYFTPVGASRKIMQRA